VAAGDFFPDLFVFEADRAGFFFVERAVLAGFSGAPMAGGGGGGSSPAAEGETAGGA
jgi:hypothetical protein